MLDKIQERISELSKNIEQVIAQHNYFAGALQEAKILLQFYIEHKDQIDKIVENASDNPVESIIQGVDLLADVFHDNNDGTTPNE